MNEHPDPDAYIDDIILVTLKRTLEVPNKSHLFVVAEHTPHRHAREGASTGWSTTSRTRLRGGPSVRQDPAAIR